MAHETIYEILEDAAKRFGDCVAINYISNIGSGNDDVTLNYRELFEKINCTARLITEHTAARPRSEATCRAAGACRSRVF